MNGKSIRLSPPSWTSLINKFNASLMLRRSLLMLFITTLTYSEACLPSWFRETRSVQEVADPSELQLNNSTLLSSFEGAKQNRTTEEEYDYYDDEVNEKSEEKQPAYNRARGKGGHGSGHHQTTQEPHLVAKFLKIQQEMCHNYCLHGAACHIVAVGTAFHPVCDCPPNTQGTRCELVFNRRMYEPISGKVQSSSLMPVMLTMVIFFLFGFGIVYYLKSARLQNMSFGSSSCSTPHTNSYFQTPSRMSLRTQSSTRTYQSSTRRPPMHTPTVRQSTNSTVMASGGISGVTMAELTTAKNQTSTYFSRMFQKTPGRSRRLNYYGGLQQAESSHLSNEHGTVHFSDQKPTIINVEEVDETR